jgi:hypothetical protein
MGYVVGALLLAFAWHVKQCRLHRLETDHHLTQIDRRLDYIVKVQQRHYGGAYQYRVETPATDAKWN